MKNISQDFAGDHSELFRLKREFSSPIQLSQGGFMICLRGESNIFIDTKNFRLTKRDIVVAFPYSIVQFRSSSSDFEYVSMAVSEDFFSSVQIENQSMLFTDIMANPVISLSDEELKRILSLREMLLVQNSNNDHPYRKEIDEAILKIILYETAAIYLLRKPNIRQKYSRDDEIFNTFILHLFNKFKTQRSLGYYAQLQHITPSHLTKVVRRVSNRTASDWVSNCVIMNIKASLQDVSTPINVISDEFNFANYSFFTQYFKRHTGMTPNSYRKSHKNLVVL